MSSPYSLRSLDILGVISAGGKSPTIWSMNHRGTLGELTEIPKEDVAFGSSLCSIPGGFALTGGFKRNACSKFYFSTQDWSPLPELEDARWGHGSICVDNVLYVIGGSIPDKHMWTNSVLKLDMDEIGATWEEGPSAPSTTLYCPKIIRADPQSSSVYVLDDDSGELYCFDTSESETRNAWSLKTKLKKPSGASMTSLGGKIYIAGGRKKDCCVYDPVTDTTSYGNKPESEHCYGSLFPVGENLMLIGGKTQSIEQYNTRRPGNWETSAVTLPEETDFGSGFLISN